jgi:hypothetical protein
VSFPINLLSIEEINAELERRKRAEIFGYRAEIAKHKEAIAALQYRVDALNNNTPQ